MALQEVVQNSDGTKALHYGAIGGWDAGRHGAGHDLIAAVKTGEVAIVHAHIAKGAPALAVDAKGGSALHWAAAKGDIEILTLLLRHGANRTVRDAKGNTPHDVARARGHREAAALLETSAGT